MGFVTDREGGGVIAERESPAAFHYAASVEGNHALGGTCPAVAAANFSMASRPGRRAPDRICVIYGAETPASRANAERVMPVRAR